MHGRTILGLTILSAMANALDLGKQIDFEVHGEDGGPHVPHPHLCGEIKVDKLSALGDPDPSDGKRYVLSYPMKDKDGKDYTVGTSAWWGPQPDGSYPKYFTIRPGPDCHKIHVCVDDSDGKKKQICDQGGEWADYQEKC